MKLWGVKWKKTEVEADTKAKTTSISLTFEDYELVFTKLGTGVVARLYVDGTSLVTYHGDNAKESQSGIEKLVLERTRQLSKITSAVYTHPK